MPTEQCETARAPRRHEQLLNMLDNLRSVTDRINDVNKRLGVKSRPQPAAVPAPVDPTMKVAQGTEDNLVSVLDMLPDAVAREIGRVSSAITDLEDNLQ